MKTIFSIIIAVFAVTNTFANNGGTNPAPKAATTMSSEMDAVLMSVINSQATVQVNATTSNSVKMTIITATETIVTNNFGTHRFNENSTSNDIAPAAAATETIELEVENL